MTTDKPQTPEHEPRPVRRWAYYTHEVRTSAFSGTTSKMESLNAIGADGWEAVGITSSSGNNFQILFKKEY